MKTDEPVQQEVIAELNCELPVDAAQIDVEVKDEIVPLADHVNSYTEKWDTARRRHPNFGKRNTG
jgi:osmotically-inducible protein OsmY